jgi:hypothetical protein
MTYARSAAKKSPSKIATGAPRKAFLMPPFLLRR